MARTCTFKAKVDSTVLNSQKVINRKIAELKATKKYKANKKEVGGSSSFIDSEIAPKDTNIPEWADEIADEESYDRYLLLNQPFN